MLRQSVFGRLAEYEDVKDAERLRRDPAMRWIDGNNTVIPGPACCIVGFLGRRKRFASQERHDASMVLALIVVAAAGATAIGEAGAQNGPESIVAAQIRSQGFACDSPQSAKRDAKASRPHQTVWLLTCNNASYRVTLIPDMAAKVETLSENGERDKDNSNKDD